MPSKSVLIAQAFSKTGVLSTTVDSAPSVNTGQVDVATPAELPDTGNTKGDFAFVQSTNRLYLWNGLGWYNIALINTTPTWDSEGQPSSSYELSSDSPQTATTITLAASDPEGLSINYSYVTSGSMDSIATVSQDSSVFTITPKNETQAPDGGTGSITFRATDGINILPQVSSFTLTFISIIENSRHTTLLATATGTSDNNNIADSSSNNHSITVSGNPYAGTFSPYRDRGYSTYFEDTAANVLYASPSSDFAFGTGAFTISVWVKLLHQYLGTIFDTNDGSNPGVMMSVNNTTFYTYSNTWLSSTSTSSQDVWQHFCWTRDGSGNNKVFVNGTQATTFTDSTNYTSQNFKMGEQQNGGNDLKAYVKDLHIVKGYAYEPDSTYADGAAEPTTGTVFLGCSLPYHGDKSSSPKTLTVANSGISIVNDTPHDYNEYAATDHGGSVYFDGTGDYLDVSDSSLDLDGTNWTIETWWYPTNLTQQNQVLIDTRPAVSLLILLNRTSSGDTNIYTGNGSGGYIGAPAIDSGSNFPIIESQWNHFALVKDGSTIYLYHNGQQVGSSTYLPSGFNGTIRIGASSGGGTDYLYGYISDLKIVKSALYTSNFTRPTAPLSSSGSTLHIKGTDASIIDKAQGSNLKLVGNTTGSTTQVKFAGSKSMYFDGTTDYIISQEPVLLGTQDFTAECWLYYQSGLELMGNRNVSDSGGFSVRMTSTSLTVGNSSGSGFGSVFSGTTSSLTNAWHHIAVSRSSGVTKIYVDGSSIASYSSTINFSLSNPFVIGYAYSNGSGAASIQGYIQDFRVTKAYARYTTNFTPPAEPLEG